MMPKASAASSSKTKPGILMNSDHGTDGPRSQVETHSAAEIAARLPVVEAGPSSCVEALHGEQREDHSARHRAQDGDPFADPEQAKPSVVPQGWERTSIPSCNSRRQPGPGSRLSRGGAVCAPSNPGPAGRP